MFWDDGELDDIHYEVEQSRRAEKKRRRAVEDRAHWDHTLAPGRRAGSAGPSDPHLEARALLEIECSNRYAALGSVTGISRDERRRRIQAIRDWYQAELKKLENS